MEISTYLSVTLANIIRYFLIAGIPFLIFYRLYPNSFVANKIQTRWAKNKDFLREVRHSMVTTLIIVAVAFAILFSPLREWTSFYTELSDFPLWWIPLSVVIALVLHDSYFYWLHRVMHHPILYSKVHLVHHKSTNPSPFTSYSFHFLEAVLEAMIAPIVLFLLPMHPLSLLLFTVTAFSINVYGHLGFEIAPKWFRNSIFFEFVNTSVHHNLHHEKFKGNYGLYFRIWDRLMNTENPDYVKQYDLIQERRFGKTNVSKSKKWMALPLLLFAFVSMSFESVNVHSKTVEPWVLEGENDPFWLKIQPSIDTKTAD